MMRIVKCSNIGSCGYGIKYKLVVYPLSDAQYRFIKDLQEQLKQKDNTIRVMVEKAAAKHRPAYDEQQRKLLALTLRSENLERVVEKIATYKQVNLNGVDAASMRWWANEALNQLNDDQRIKESDCET